MIRTTRKSQVRRWVIDIRCFVPVMISIVFSFSLYGQAVIQTQLDSAAFKADIIAQKVFADGNFPGMAVAVYHDGQLWSRGYGYADIARKVEIDPANSLFRIGSISKTLTAVGLMKLYAENKINLDTFVQVYVPGFPLKRYPLTTRQVAQHVGGIRHYRGFEFMSNIHYSTVSDGLVIFANDTLLFEPGTQYSYSSYGWNLISAAMETCSGQDFITFMHDHVFQPLEMDNTLPDDATVALENRVAFYMLQEDTLAVAPQVDNSYKWAGGGFLSTAEDLITFGKAALEKDFLSEEILLESWTTYTLPDGKSTNYGIGWSIGEDKKGRHWVGHGGGSVGGSSMFVVYPDHDLIVVTLVNLTRANTGDLAFRLAEQFLSN